MAVTRGSIDWALALQACLHEWAGSIAAHFQDVPLSQALRSAKSEKAERRAFSPADLEAIRKAPFGNQPYEDVCNFLVALLPNLVRQLAASSQRGCRFRFYVDPAFESVLRVRFCVIEQIGLRDYNIELTSRIVHPMDIHTWGDLLDVATEVAELAVAELEEWSYNRQYIRGIR